MTDIPRHREYSLRPWAPAYTSDLVRVGRANDGGYVVNRGCVMATDVLVSFGVADDWSFEAEFLKLNERATFVALDGSVSTSAFLLRGAEAFARSARRAVQLRPSAAAREMRAGLRAIRTAIAFRRYFGRDRRFHSLYLSDVSGPWQTSWLDLRAMEPLLAPRPGLSLFVKMDIEGAEFRVLSDVLRDADDICGLAIEFHDCDVHWDCFSELMAEISRRFVITHIHGNNYVPKIRNSTTPRTLEVTAARRDLVELVTSQTRPSYPLLGLDMPCDPNRPDYPLSF